MNKMNKMNNGDITMKILLGIFASILILYLLNTVYTNLPNYISKKNSKTKTKTKNNNYQLESSNELNDSALDDPADSILNNFLDTSCSKKEYSSNYTQCYSSYGYDVNSQMLTIGSNLVERTTVKAVMKPGDKYKLMNLKDYFIPSMLNGTFCDVVFSSYYDYPDLFHISNKVFKMKKNISKAIRIRYYHFEPNVYFELKYNGVKIRTVIDSNYNIVKPESIDPKYKEMVMTLLDKIKSGELTLVFKNTYKRLSFIYKNDPSIRMTMDTNIEFDHNGKKINTDFDIFELKYPKNMEYSEVENYLDEINELAGTKLKFKDFSKVEYLYHESIEGVLP